MKKYLLLLGLAAAGISSPAPAADTTTSAWNGGTTVWGTSGNWDGGLPSATVSALFNGTFTNQPQLGATGTAQGIWLATGDAQDVTITGTGATRILNITGTATLGGQGNAGILLDDSANHNLSIGTLTTTTLTNSTGFYVNNAGTLTVGNTNLAGNTLTLAGTNSSGTTAITGVIGTTSSAGSLVVNTAGKVTLSATNLFVGGVTLTAGTLNLNNVRALGAAAAGAFVINGGTIDTTNAVGTLTSLPSSTTFGGDFAYGGTSNLNMGVSAISNTGNRTITLNGTGRTLTFGGLMTNASGAAQTTTVNGAGNTLSLGGYALSNSAADYTNVINGTGNVNITGAITNGGTSTLSGLTYSGNGTLTLSGGNTFGGGITLASGTLKLGNDAALGAAGSALTITGGSIDVTAARATTNNNAQNWNGDFTYIGTNSWNTGTGNISMNASRQVTVSASTMTVGGVISGGFSLTKAGAGTLALTGNNNYTGDTTISAGTLTIGVGGRLNGGDYAGDIINNGTLNVAMGASSSQTFSGNISGSGTLTNGGVITQTITLSGDNSYSGGSTLNTSVFVLGHKNAFGTGTVTMVSGQAPIISAGVDLSGANAIANNVAMNAPFIISGSNNMTLSGIITLDINRMLTVSNTAATVLSGPIHLSNGVTSGTLTLTASPGSGPITVSGLIDEGAAPQGLKFSLTSGALIKLTNVANSYTGATEGTGTASGNLEVSKLANGGSVSSIGASTSAASNLILSLSSTLRYVGSGDSTDRLFTVSGASAGINSSGSGALNFTSTGNIAYGAVDSARTLTLTGTNTDSNTFSPVIANNGAGVVALTKSGAGTWVLTGANSYTGATSMGVANGTDAGILRLSGAGKISAAATTVNSGSLDVGGTNQTITTLGLGAGASGTSANVLIGSGGVLNLGGTLTYTATNNSNGATISGAGTLNLNSARAFAVGDSTAASQDLTINSIIADGSAASSINKTQAGTLVLGGNNTYSGGTTLTLGTLGVSHNSALGSGGLTLAGTVTLQAVANDVTLANAVSGTTITLTISGTKNLTLNGGLTSTGDITLTNSIGAGKLLTIGSLNIGAGAAVPRTMIVNGAGDLAVTGAIANGAGATATQNFSSRTTGTTTLSGNNTLTGITSVTTGTLVISSGSINTSSAVTVSGGKLKYDSSTGLTRTVTVTGGATFAYNSSADYTGTLTLTNGKLGGMNWNGAKLGGLTIGADKTITPGNSVGTAATTTQTWASSGSYDWEINKATGGIAGDVNGGWDLLTLSGALTLSATNVTPFSINIISLGLDNLPGLATGFSDGLSYNWLIADAGSAISGFSADKFSLSAAGFQNAFTGTFGIELGNTGTLVGIGDTSQLYITYTAIPEPSTWALLAASGTIVMVLRRRRRD